MTRQLVTLRDDVPIELDLQAARCDMFEWQAIAPILSELGFRRMLEQLPGDVAAAPRGGRGAARAPSRSASSGCGTEEHKNEPPNTDSGGPLAAIEGPDVAAIAAALRDPDPGEYQLVNTPDSLDQLASELASQPAFAVDTETTGTDPMDATLVGVSLSWRVGRGYYVPTRCVHGGELPIDLVREKLAPSLADPAKLKIGQNLKYDMLILRQAGMPVAGPLFDTMIAAFVLDPMHASFAMDRIVDRMFGHQMIPITELLGKRGRDQMMMDQVLLDHIAEYAGEDADYTFRLWRFFEPQLRGSTFERLFYQIEMPLMAVLADMEWAGISLDTDLLQKMSRELSERMEALTHEAHALVDHPFNLDSPKQLAEILFDQMGMRVIRKTKTARSTDADTLQALAREHGSPLPGVLLEYREYQKLRSTYLDALPAARSKRTGRVHTSYHQTGAVTGRLSSSEPNLQNIPIRTELGRRIRGAFVPRDDDGLLIVADYSQIELRVMAHFSGDEALIQAFSEDRDIHAVVAAQVNGVALEDVTREMRGRAKAVNFGIIYGQTAFGLALGTGMGRGEAQLFIDTYFRKYARVQAFIHQSIGQARRRGYVETLLGRRREIRDIDSRNRTARAAAERFAVNTIIQGSAADLIKLAMVNLHERIRAQELPLRMLLQVHDELVCEGPAARADELSTIVAEVMSGAMELRVPLKVDVATGKSWLDAK
jgi:DNA polymerase-1